MINYNNISVEPAGKNYTLLVKGQDAQAQALGELGARIGTSRSINRGHDVTFTDGPEKIAALIDQAHQDNLLGSATHSHLHAYLEQAKSGKSR